MDMTDTQTAAVPFDGDSGCLHDQYTAVRVTLLCGSHTRR